MEDSDRTKLSITLGALLEPMEGEGTQELANGIAQEYPEYKAMAEAVHTNEHNEDGLDRLQK